MTALSVEIDSPFEPAQAASEPVDAQAGQSVAFDHTFQLTAVANAALEQVRASSRTLLARLIRLLLCGAPHLHTQGCSTIPLKSQQGLLGAPMRVSVFDRTGGAKVLLSTADVDLASFAAGQTALEASCPLAPATPEVEAKLLPGASAAVAVALLAPTCLASPEDAEGGVVVTVAIEGVSPPPTIFTTVRLRGPLRV